MKKRLLAIILFITLLFGISYFDYIPIKILGIDFSSLPLNTRIIYLTFCDIICIIIIFLIFHKNLIKDLKDYFKNWKTYLNTSFKYYVIGFIFMVITNFIISFFFKDANAANESIVREQITIAPLYMIFSISIYAPFVEEIIFRKSTYNIFKHKYSYIIGSGFIFALLHVLGASDNLTDYIYVIPYLSLGIAFSCLYYDTKNIWTTISMHFFHNTVMLILYFMEGVV